MAKRGARVVEFGDAVATIDTHGHVNGRVLRSGLVVALALVLAMCAAAPAQTSSPLGNWKYSACIPLEKLYPPNTPDREVLVGAGASFQPRYDGSDRYCVLVGPNLDIRYRDLALVSSGEGVGVNCCEVPIGAQAFRLSTILDGAAKTIPPA